MSQFTKVFCYLLYRSGHTPPHTRERDMSQFTKVFCYLLYRLGPWIIVLMLLAAGCTPY